MSPPVRRRRSSAPLAVLLAALIGGFGAFGVITAADSRTSDVERIEGLELVLTAQDGPARNYLLIGSDSRENADPNDPDFGGIGDVNAVQGRRSDTIMILRQEADGNGAAVVSLPRDLWIDIAGGRGESRINSAYSDGTDVLAATITQELGIPIHHVVDIDFNGFKDLVDAVGGTTICFEYATRDANTGLDQQPGCSRLDGLQSLQYARSRYYEEFRDGAWRTDPTADLGRIERQQNFLQLTANSTIAKLQSDPFLASKLIDAGTSAVRMDPGLDPIAAAGTLRKAFSTGLNKYQLPVVGVTRNGNAVLLLGDGAEPILDYFRGVGPPPPVTP
ncbi:MAG TPA: LCP family protein [Ilumatobacteraceae bacterium]|nr:LCP family protein [Ilumatobacteraceae bacterium]